MKLSNFITERLKITSNTQSANLTEHTLFPKDKKGTEIYHRRRAETTRT